VVVIGPENEIFTALRAHLDLAGRQRPLLREAEADAAADPAAAADPEADGPEADDPEADRR